jgi:hypothetical protein
MMNKLSNLPADHNGASTSKGLENLNSARNERPDWEEQQAQEDVKLVLFVCQSSG